MFDISLGKRARVEEKAVVKAETMEKIRNVYEAYNNCKNKKKNFLLHQDSSKYASNSKSKDKFYRRTVYNS